MDIQLVDVSARDGLQNEPNAAALSAADKIAYIKLLVDSGLKRIEAGSFVHPKVASMANSDEVAVGLQVVQTHFPDVIFSYLVPNLKGLERAKTARAKEIAIFLGLSEAFSKANINQSVEESFAAIQPVIDAAAQADMRVRGYLSTVFGYNDLPFNPREAAQRTRQLLEMGCYEVSLGDTTGIAAPAQVRAVIEALGEQEVPLYEVAMHFHDTQGRAIGNVEISYEMGIRTFDASTGGLGGCPYAKSPKGNLAMEDLVAWCAKQDLSCDVASIDTLRRAGKMIRQKLGKADV